MRSNSSAFFATGAVIPTAGSEVRALAQKISERCAYLGTNPVSEKLLKEIAGIKDSAMSIFDEAIQYLTRERFFIRQGHQLTCNEAMQKRTREAAAPENKIPLLRELMRIFTVKINSPLENLGENWVYFGNHCAALEKHLTDNAISKAIPEYIKYLCAWCYLELNVNKRKEELDYFERQLSVFYGGSMQPTELETKRQLTLLLGEIYLEQALMSEDESLKKMRFINAESFLTESLGLCNRNGLASVKAATLLLLGKLEYSQNKFSDAAEYYLEAKKIYEKMFEGVESLFSDMRVHPAIVTIYCTLVQIMLEQDDFEQAWQCYEKAQENYSEMHVVNFDMAEMLYKFGKWISNKSDEIPAAKEFFASRAEKYFQTAAHIYGLMFARVASSTMKQKLYYQRGNMLYEQAKIIVRKQEGSDWAKRASGILEEAKKIFEEVHVANPNHPDLAAVWQGFGRIQELKRNYEESLKSYAKSLEIFMQLQSCASEVQRPKINAAIEKIRTAMDVIAKGEAVAEAGAAAAPRVSRMAEFSAQLSRLEIDPSAVSVAPASTHSRQCIENALSPMAPTEMLRVLTENQSEVGAPAQAPAAGTDDSAAGGDSAPALVLPPGMIAEPVVPPHKRCCCML